jgi:hypothetical protein
MPESPLKTRQGFYFGSTPPGRTASSTTTGGCFAQFTPEFPVDEVSKPLRLLLRPIENDVSQAYVAVEGPRLVVGIHQSYKVETER